MNDQMTFTTIASAVAMVTTGAMIIVIRLFLRTLRDRDRAFTSFLENHMSKNTAAMEHVAVSLQGLASEVRFARLAASRAHAKEE